MIKTITVAQCDICGATEPAKAVTGQYNETEYNLPNGWKKSTANDKFCICNQCLKKLESHTLGFGGS